MPRHCSPRFLFDTHASPPSPVNPAENTPPPGDQLPSRCRRGCPLPPWLSFKEWALLAPFIPPAQPGGRPRTTDMREVLNAIFVDTLGLLLKAHVHAADITDRDGAPLLLKKLAGPSPSSKRRQKSHAVVKMAGVRRGRGVGAHCHTNV